MSVITLAITCLTTSKLPWFMDLRFQVLMQYSSSQHQIFLPSSVTFCFGSVSLFFLELFVHSSPVAYWVPTDPGSSLCSVISFLPFHTVWFWIGNGVCQCCILSSCLFKLCAGYIMRNSRLDEAQATIKIVNRNINDLRYADDTPLWQKVKKNWNASSFQLLA